VRSQQEELLQSPGPEAWVRIDDRPRGPRIYYNHIQSHGRDAHPGGLVAVVGRDNERFGWALFHPDSNIVLRIIDRGERAPTIDEFRERARRAARRRVEDPEIPADVCRILHGEADGFPALLVDRYGPLLVAEAFSRGSAALFKTILPALEEVLGTTEYRLSFEERAARAEGERPFAENSPNAPNLLQIEEAGLRYELDFARGHKTGFFCDQRENRASFAALAKGKRVLDVCCYTGGFALAAARAGAEDILALDLDEKAIAQAKRNANLNGNLSRQIKFVHADAFSYLRTLVRNERTFDLIVVDPPKFVHNRHSRDEGIARYHDINKLAIPLLEPGGDYLTCSCSGLVTGLELQELVRRSARLRPLQVRRKTGAGPDHPVSLDFPEGEYLKALWMRDSSGS